MIRIAIFLFCITLSNLALANYIKVTSVTINSVSAYGEGYQPLAGDLLIQVNSPDPACDKGYYIKNDSLGKESLLSVALSAFHTSSLVNINAYTTPGWTLNGNYCHIEAIHLVK